MMPSISNTCVTIGLPTFNRANTLARMLDSIICQSWTDLEIIISDNCSTDLHVAEIISKYQLLDSRIRVYRQPKNIGAHENFFFVLKQARTEYFMWAADDDVMEPWFVERCVNRLIADPTVALATMEAQYLTPDNIKLPFVAEGVAFRKRTSDDVFERINHMLQNNYGNLVYGLFRRHALIQDRQVFWQKIGLVSLNEIPPLLFSSMIGQTIVEPDIGFYKQAPATVHAQVVWELRGGRSPRESRIRGFRSLANTWKYHWLTILDVDSALTFLPLADKIKGKLRRRSRLKIILHFLYMVAAYRPAKKVRSST